MGELTSSIRLLHPKTPTSNMNGGMARLPRSRPLLTPHSRIIIIIAIVISYPDGHLQRVHDTAGVCGGGERGGGRNAIAACLSRSALPSEKAPGIVGPVSNRALG